MLDGELVAFDAQGRPSFQLLQNNLSRALPVYFYAFDLLNRNGELLVDMPIERRRELLGSMLAAPEDPLRLSPLLRAPSSQIIEAVRKLGLEGIVGKRVDSTYEPGERSGAWITEITTEKSTFRKRIIFMRCEFGAYDERQREVISLRSGKDILFKYRCSSWTNAPSRLRNSFAICRCCAATSVCSRGSAGRTAARIRHRYRRCI